MSVTHDLKFPDNMPNPTPEQIASPEFAAIWQVIKSWDVNVPEFYEGYCGASGSHVVLILDALKDVMTPGQVRYGKPLPRDWDDHGPDAWEDM